MNKHERAKEAREALNMTQKAFAIRIFRDQAYVSMVETGKHWYSESILRLIELEFGIRRSWLETGKGEMHFGTKKKAA